MFYPDKNFINTLSEGEKFIFLKAICGLVATDRQISREELLYLKEMALKYNVSGETLSTMIKTADRETIPAQVRKITNRSKALMLIKDLCMVANTDADFADNEIDYILDVADAMGIEPQRVRDINSLVNQYFSISQKAAHLLEQDNWM